MTTAGESRRPRPPRPLRLSALVIAVIVVLAGIGYVYLRSTRQPVEIYVAARDLPVYHQITQADVRLATVPAGRVPKNAVRDREDLVDHYTLRAVAQDNAFGGPLVGPRLTPGALDGLALVALDSSPETTLGGRLARGDRVDILLSATTASKSGQSFSLSDVLVLDVQPEALIVGLRAADEQILGKDLGSSRLAVVRASAYTEQ